MTSAFHMPRTSATFDFLYALAGAQYCGSPCHFLLDYHPVSDAGIFDPAVIAARAEKEAAAVEAWRRNTAPLVTMQVRPAGGPAGSRQLGSALTEGVWSLRQLGWGSKQPGRPMRTDAWRVQAGRPSALRGPTASRAPGPYLAHRTSTAGSSPRTSAIQCPGSTSGARRSGWTPGCWPPTKAAAWPAKARDQHSLKMLCAFRAACESSRLAICALPPSELLLLPSSLSLADSLCPP